MGSEAPQEVLYTIGQFARLSLLSIKTLRHYDEEGVLKPAVVDGATGYRSYTRAQLHHAHLLRGLRFVHVPVDELRAFMAEPTEEHQRRLYDRHIAHLEEELAALGNRLRTVRRKREHPWRGQAYEVRAQTRPAVPFLFLRYRVNLVGIEEAREAAFAEIRAYLERHRAEPRSPPTCLYLPEEGPRDERHVCDVHAGFEVNGPVRTAGHVHFGWLPGGTWYTARHVGLYEYLGYASTPLLQRLLADGARCRQGRGEFVTAEVYHVGPWDTPDPGRLVTEVRWLVHPDTPLPVSGLGRD